MNNEDFNSALEKANEFIKSNSQDPNGHVFKGIVLTRLEKYSEALASLKDGREISPEFPNINMLIVQLTFALNLHEEAVDAFERWSHMEPTNTKPLLGLISLLWDMREYEEQLRFCDRYLELDSSNPDVYLAKAKTLIILKSPQEALKAAESGLELQENSSDLHQTRSLALFSLEAYEKVIELSNAYLERDANTVWCWRHKADALLRVGRDDEVNECIQKIAELDPGSEVAEVAKAAKLAEEGSLEEALSYYDEILTKNYASKANILQGLNRFEEALEVLNVALQISSDWNLHLGKGYTLFRLERYEEAIKSYSRVLELNPEEFHSLYTTAVSHWFLNNHTKADDYFTRASNLGPDYKEQVEKTRVG
eukprot:CAMPEP_0115043594 /NCGR_PEP_ID=MMETSP0216-20121206/46956_1 /TAXON_ID=223996 /ORGANISM="Protocruzia adherens, Strain Boccale" /LENGTH=366 /DNA_ID=CAMNT_0002425933 /DNA_START=167 /DNA_END=1264 /DNA_ORIENTATION=-